MNIFYAIGMLIIALLLVGAGYQFVATIQDKRKYPPPGKMIDVGGYRLHLLEMGDSATGPTVILDAGMVSFSSNWAWIQPEVAKVTRVVAYDRAGLGWSDAGPKPRDAGQSVRELYAALKKANITGPFIVVGHSYGGLVAQAFAALHPGEVAGMVLVDGSHPDQWIRFKVPSRTVSFGNRVGAVLARFGVFRIFDKEVELLAAGLPPRQYGAIKAFGMSPRALQTGSEAAMVWDAVSRPLVKAAKRLGQTPLIVLSVTEQPRMAEQLTALQKELVQLSDNSKHLVVQGAYHEGLVSRSEYAGVVSQAIIDVVNAARTGQPIQTFSQG